MSQLEEQLQTIDARTLTKLVRKSVSHRTMEVITWSYSLIKWNAINPVTAGLYRFKGTALEHDQLVPWSLILKIIHWVDILGDGGYGYITDPSDWNYWKREALVFQSGILDHCKGNLVPVQCYDIVEQIDGSIWIWLEEVKDVFFYRWPPDRYVLAARHCGEFNALHLERRDFSNYPWLCRQFLRKWVKSALAFGIADTVKNPDLWNNPHVKLAFPQSRAKDILRLLQNSDDLLALLERQPRTLSHLDTYRPNLFARRNVKNGDQTVAIDWSLLGLAAVGEDLGAQVSENLFFLEVEISEAYRYQETAFEAYLEGLYDMGWQGTPELLRFAYATHASIRCITLAAHMLGQLYYEDGVTSWVDQWAKKFDFSPTETLQRWGAAVLFCFELAEQARELANQM